MRLHELTKELDADGKRLLELSKELGLGVKSHSSNLARGIEGILRAAWSEELLERSEREEKKAAKAKAKAAASGPSIALTIKSSTAPVAEVVADQADVDEPAVAEVVSEETVLAPAETAETTEEALPESTDDTAVTEPEEVLAAEPVAAEPEAVTEASPEAVDELDAPAETSEASEPGDVGEPAPAPEADEAAEATELAAEAVEADPAPVAADEAASESAPAAEAAAVAEDQREMVVTFGGKPAGGDEEPADESGEAVDEAGKAAAAKATEKELAERKAVRQIGVVNVPTRRERKGAKILGKIDLKAKPAEEPTTSSSPRRRGGQQGYDPLDPTRAMPQPEGRHGATARKDTDYANKPRGTGRPGKPGGDFVFDPEDSSSLSAIRLGHFGNRRRPPPRRPPMRRSRMGGRRAKKAVPVPTHPVTVRPPISVRDLSLELGIKSRQIIMSLPEVFDPRDRNARNGVLDAENLVELAVAINREINILDPDTAEGRMLTKIDKLIEAAGGEFLPRPPVVAVMGHVDHGKTTLLDTLRKARVAAKEVGGITQMTSAYSVSTESGATVTFLDTPGHKAFTEMRARGASVTDVAVLVVAADDGVMEQTQEAIDHAVAASVPMVVAINKIDKPGSDPMKVRQQLASAGVLVEDYGGDVGVVECSATTGQGLDALIERLALETELLELGANAQVPARGVVIDSRKDSKLGVVTTVVVQQGTLRAKDSLLAGTSVGRVRWLLDDRGKRITEAGPSCPAQVVGFEEPPAPGSTVYVVSDVATAKVVAAERIESGRERRAAAVDAVTLENLFETIESQKVTEINVLIKADNMGSLDVVRQTVLDVSHPEVRFRVLRAGLGAITEDDVLLASASSAFIIGFGVVPDVRGRAAVNHSGVDVKFYEIIYEMTDDLEKALEGELGTESIEDIIGHANIRAIFKASKYGNIAGCYVTDGILHRDARIRLVRDGVVVYTGKLDSLKRFKDDVREVRENYECGLHLNSFNDIKEADVLEAFTVTEVKRTLDSEPVGSA